MISNLSGTEVVEANYYDYDLKGPIEVSFSFFKNEFNPPSGLGFGVEINCYYFESGENKVETNLWLSNSGNLPWNQKTFSVGVDDRLYYLIKVSFFLDKYNADVGIDHFLIKDKNGEKYREAFEKTRLLGFDGRKTYYYYDWVYDSFSRNKGWEFLPKYSTTYFEVLYLDN
jgi:hypothetical protein